MVKPKEGKKEGEGKSEKKGVSTTAKDAIVKATAGGPAPAIAKPKAKSSKKEEMFRQFITEVLPSLKKEMVQKKREPFDWSKFAHYFKPESGFKPTFILPLFRFLLSDEVVCDRYGNFSNRHRVKTDEGYNRVMTLSAHSDVLELTPEMLQYFSRRFGMEWFKIPPKDGHRAKAAAAAGYEGKFKVILLGMTEDSFPDSKTGEEILTINPILTYEPCLPPPPKKEKKPKTPKPTTAAAAKEAAVVLIEAGAQPSSSSIHFEGEEEFMEEIEDD